MHWWAVLLVPAIGGLLCGQLVYGFAPEAEGHGTDAMVKAFHRLGGKIRVRVPLVKSLASIVTIGTGGSAVREGPIAQIGAGFGSFPADMLKLSERERRLLVLAGGAGGIGAIFRAPLGGALFVSEVLYSSTALEFAAVIPAFIASITAYTVFAAIIGPGLASSACSRGKLQRRGTATLSGFRRCLLNCRLYLRASLLWFEGPLLSSVADSQRPETRDWWTHAGGIALWLPQLMSGGYGWIQMAIDGRLTIAVMLVLCFGKIVVTSFTISSGGSGGVFAPSLFIGASTLPGWGEVARTG